MKTKRTSWQVTAVLVLFVVSSGSAFAGGPCYGPECGGKRPAYYSLHGFLSGSKPKPVFQAAPWYLYWPYDGHFLTPAPISGPFYAPPAFPGGGANPYFPAPVLTPPPAVPTPPPPPAPTK